MVASLSQGQDKAGGFVILRAPDIFIAHKIGTKFNPQIMA